MPNHTTVSRREWIEARKAHLAREKEFTRLRDQLSAERRALPWVRVDKAYVFEGPEGKATLADLFDGRRQLIVYHFMFGPGWEEGCPSCSFLADHIDGAAVHLAQRDVTLLAVSRAPLRQIEAFKRRMGWRFTWVSSHGTDFNFDYRVSLTRDEIAKGSVDYNFGLREFPSEEAPGISVFYKDEHGDVFHTYSAYARGLDLLVGAYNYLDLAPKGRDEGVGRQQVRVRRRPRHSPVVRRHAAPVGVHASLASRTVPDRSGYHLRRGSRRRLVPLDGWRPDVAGAPRTAWPRLGVLLAAGRRRVVPAHDPSGSEPSRADLHRHLGGGRLPDRRRRQDMAADEPRPAVGTDPQPDGRGRSLRSPHRDAPVASPRAVHAEALGRHA